MTLRHPIGCLQGKAGEHYKHSHIGRPERGGNLGTGTMTSVFVVYVHVTSLEPNVCFSVGMTWSRVFFA